MKHFVNSIFPLIVCIILAIILAASAIHGGEAKPLSKQLIEAAREGQLETMKLLVDQGADINAKSNVGMMPMHEADGVGSLDVMEWLKEQGTDQTRGGHTGSRVAAGEWGGGMRESQVTNEYTSRVARIHDLTWYSKRNRG